MESVIVNIPIEKLGKYIELLSLTQLDKLLDDYILVKQTDGAAVSYLVDDGFTFISCDTIIIYKEDNKIIFLGYEVAFEKITTPDFFSITNLEYIIENCRNFKFLYKSLVGRDHFTVDRTRCETGQIFVPRLPH